MLCSCQKAARNKQEIVETHSAEKDYFPHKAVITHARNFSVSYHKNYKVVRTSATLGEWDTAGGEVKDVEDVMVLVQQGTPVPALRDELAGATVITVPTTQRLATNSSGLEIWMDMLALTPNLVAIGGTKTYDDSLRQLAQSGKIGQVGYSWAAPPDLEVLLTHRPDLFFMVISRVGFSQSLDKTRKLGIPAAPVFDWAERDYLAGAEWIKYCALFTNQEAVANARYSEIERNVQRLKQLVATTKTRPVCLWAHFVDSGFWLANSNNAQTRLLQDAGVLDPAADTTRVFNPIGEAFTNEQLLMLGRNADYWIIGNGVRTLLPDNIRYLEGFKAWRTGKLYHHYLRSKPEHNAYDWFNLWPVRPDLALADLVALFHPELLPNHQFVFFEIYEKSAP